MAAGTTRRSCGESGTAAHERRRPLSTNLDPSNRRRGALPLLLLRQVPRQCLALPRELARTAPRPLCEEGATTRASTSPARSPRRSSRMESGPGCCRAHVAVSACPKRQPTTRGRRARVGRRRSARATRACQGSARCVAVPSCAGPANVCSEGDTPRDGRQESHGGQRRRERRGPDRGCRARDPSQDVDGYATLLTPSRVC